MLSINTNLSSMIAQNSLTQSTSKLNQAIERMSTGYKINHASDNAANYSISTNMTTKMSAYQVAEDNTEMGLDMVTSASETLSEMENYATRLRALATQAQNGTYGDKSLKAMQSEANAIYEEINRLYSTAKYNGISLFNRSEYDLPDYMPKADPITGFIDDPYDYEQEYVDKLTAVSEVKDSFTESEYKIATVEDLVKLAELTNNGVSAMGKTFILANDLDLKEYCEKNIATGGWTPIGNETNKFKGTFNGNGNIISNLIIDRPSQNHQGLFGYNYAGGVLNLGIENADIKGNTYLGTISGIAGVQIINCFAIGSIKGSSYIGGISGFSSKMENCYADCNISGKHSTGGLIGESQGVLKNSYAIGNVYATATSGGLIGQIYGANRNIQLLNCYFGGVVEGDNIKRSLVGNVTNTVDGVNISRFEIKDCAVRDQNVEFFKIGSYNGVVYDQYLQEMISGVKILEKVETSTALQVGVKSNSNSQINFNTNFEYNLGKIVRNGIDSDESLELIDSFINTISAKQTELGAVTNRLESALDEIAIQYDNLASSRSTLRDADMAKLSSQYIKMQILQQASATLLATANQSPSIALQLI